MHLQLFISGFIKGRGDLAVAGLQDMALRSKRSIRNHSSYGRRFREKVNSLLYNARRRMQIVSTTQPSEHEWERHSQTQLYMINIVPCTEKLAETVLSFVVVHVLVGRLCDDELVSKVHETNPVSRRAPKLGFYSRPRWRNRSFQYLTSSLSGPV